MSISNLSGLAGLHENTYTVLEYKKKIVAKRCMQHDFVYTADLQT